ncbi:hypothetical protein CCH79_00017171, partial [Gambusia affinis]
MILSSFAGIIMSRLPVEKILALYRCKPVVFLPSHQSKVQNMFWIIFTFTLMGQLYALSLCPTIHLPCSDLTKLYNMPRDTVRLNREYITIQSSAALCWCKQSFLLSILQESSGFHQEAAEHYEGSQQN